MTVPSDYEPLKQSVGRLRGFGVVPVIGQRLASEGHELAASLAERVVKDVPEFRDSGNPDSLPLLSEHLRDLTDDLARVLSGHRIGDFDWAANYARSRAQYRFPLDALLRAYRGIHQQLAVRVRDIALDTADDAAELRRVVAAAADFVIEYLGLLTPLMTARYVEHTRRVAAAEGDRRQELLNLLLDGYDETDARIARLLRSAGYLAQRQSYCVVAARAVNAAEMENPARAQRMADAIRASLGNVQVRSIVGIRDHRVYAVVSATRRQSGWTAPQSLLAERIYAPLRTVGPAALIGLSTDVPSTAHIPRAAAEARFALESADVADRVLPYAALSFRRLLVANTHEDVRSALPAWTEPFLAADRKARGSLSATLRAYGDASMNAQKASTVLDIHPNTLYARMTRIKSVTDLCPFSFHGLTEMLLVLDCCDAGHERSDRRL